MSTCPFCNYEERQIVWSNDLVVAFRDGFSVSEGHTLVVPRRHVETYFEASAWEQQALWQGVDAVSKLLDKQFKPDGYNVGFNAGVAAGQTVMHLHIHVIPRYTGDVDDPRGGVRGVIPSKQKYAMASSPAVESSDPFARLPRFVPGGEHHFGETLRGAMRLANQIDFVAAFVQKSGLEVLEDELVDALERGAQVRLLTGDYLGITHPHAIQGLYTLSTRFENLSVRLFRVRAAQVFHPKAYLFIHGEHGVAFVGSSNLSRSALTHGIEWNLKTSRVDVETFKQIRQSFEDLYSAPEAVTLTAEVVSSYQGRVRVPPAPEPAAKAPEPHKIQVEVLEKIAKSRVEGHTKGLVVMATGLGKTYLSAFDFLKHGGKRALFVAHREEILHQSANTWGKVLPDKSIGFLTGAEKQPDAELLFASVQTLSRVKHLRSFEPGHFDYLVVDEFHHAAAHSYRKLLAHFKPSFLLGLTATPNRMDGAVLLDLCGSNEIARVGLVEGISQKLLVPFRYYGVRDSLDFEPIPWRSGRFQADQLTAAASTEERAAQALSEYRKHAPSGDRRSLVFCCSRLHADFMAAYLRDHGVPSASVHSGETSDPRASSLAKLRAGTIEAICAVDVFNEGVDLPDVNTILMLRPTESPVVFLQQLGRGLRPGRTVVKPELVVVDFIGNHRSFMVKPQALVALVGQDVPPGAALRILREGRLDLPEGCSVEIETEALDMLERVAKLSSEDHLLYHYLQLRDELGRRPSARELFGAGVHLKPIKQRYGTWFDFLAAQGDLTEEEEEVFQAHKTWFQDLMKTQMTRSYKMIALGVMNDADALHNEMEVAELAYRSREVLLRDPVLRSELNEHQDAGGGLSDFVPRWREMPLGVFHRAKGFSKQWFLLDGERFISQLDVEPAMRVLFNAMTEELVELRLREHLAKTRFASRVLSFSAPIELKVSHSSGNPILRFDRARRPDIPMGPTVVSIDGDPYTLKFVKIAVNVAWEVEGEPNILPRLMRSWFGPTAGQPGTRHRVMLSRVNNDEWTLRPRIEMEGLGEVIPLGRIPYYPELRAACGLVDPQYEGHDYKTSLAVKSERALDPKLHFVVRASGDSMDGGNMPIRDGDLVLCESVDALAGRPDQFAGKTVLLSGGSVDDAFAMIKQPLRSDGRWTLRSSNPAVRDQELPQGTQLRIAARVLEVVEEQRDPVLWGLYDRDVIAGMFGHQNNPSWQTGYRDVEINGEAHTVLMVNLRKPKDTPLEHRYADRFLSPEEFQWESQASTARSSAKGQRILNQQRDGRFVHLFVRYHTKDAKGRVEPYTYCGTLQYLRSEDERPIRVWWQLDHPLPEGLWQIWGEG